MIQQRTLSSIQHRQKINYFNVLLSSSDSNFINLPKRNASWPCLRSLETQMKSIGPTRGSGELDYRLQKSINQQNKTIQSSMIVKLEKSARSVKEKTLDLASETMHHSQEILCSWGGGGSVHHSEAHQTSLLFLGRCNVRIIALCD